MAELQTSNNQSNSPLEWPEVACRMMHLYKEGPKHFGGKVRLSSRLEWDGAEPHFVWFEFSEELLPMTTPSMDPFLVACIFVAMEQPTKLHVHGEISPSLLRNLTEFQAAWHCWLPEKYTPAEITADQERESQPDRTDRSTIAAFSGGVDSTYTIWRHTIGDAKRDKCEIEAGLLVHGFDIPLDQEEQFSRAAETAAMTLKSVGLKLLTMKSNLYHPDWEMTHGAAIAACLMLFQDRYGAGLIASTYDYSMLDFPWGSNIITDRMLSSDAFAVVHDGSSTSREDKQKAISKWTEGFNNLRVCYSASDRDRNCCSCAKCVMNLIAFQALSLPRPQSFERDISAGDILGLKDLNESFAQVFKSMADYYQNTSFRTAPWFSPLERCARYNQRRILLEKPLKNGFQEWLRKKQLRRHIQKGP